MHFPVEGEWTFSIEFVESDVDTAKLCVYADLFRFPIHS